MDPDWTPQPVDLLLGYVAGMKLLAEPSWGGTWHPDRNHQQHHRTETAYWTWRTSMSRGKSWHVLTKRISRVLKDRKLLAEGRLKIRRLIDNGTIDMSDIPDNDKERAELALGYCVALLRDDTKDAEPAKIKLDAAKTLLTFVKAKPVTKVETTIRTAEDFLNDLPDD